MCGSKIAVKDNQNVYTYSEMKMQIERVSNIIRENGLTKGDRVALYLPNSFSFIVTYFACSKNGVICVPLNWINNPLNIKYILKDSDCSALISYESKIKELALDKPIKENIIDGAYMVLLKPIKKDNSKIKATILEDINILLYTSGSTGQPKGVMLTHFNIYIGAKIVAQYLRMNEQDIVLALLPFSFDYGLNQIVSTFLVSGTLIIRYPYLFFELPAILKNEKITLNLRKMTEFPGPRFPMILWCL